MPKMKPKKMTISEAIALCMEEYDIPEMPVISDEEKMDQEVAQCYAEYEKANQAAAKEIAQRVALEMDIAWDEHNWREYIDNAEEGYFTEYYVRKYFEALEAAEESDQDQSVPQKDMKAAKRRKQKARYKKKVRRNAINADKNNLKRSEDDQKATANRGGFVVGERKSRTMKADRLKTQAEKMKLVTDEDFGS